MAAQILGGGDIEDLAEMSPRCRSPKMVMKMYKHTQQEASCIDNVKLKIKIQPLWSEDLGWPDQIGEGKDAIKIPDFFKKKCYRSIPLFHVLYWAEFKKTKFPFKYLRAFEKFSMVERLQILKNNQQKLNSEGGDDISSEIRIIGGLYISHISSSLKLLRQ